MGWAQPQKGICANYMYELAVLAQGAGEVWINLKTKHFMYYRNLMLLRKYIEFLVTTWNYKYHKFEPVCNKLYFQRLIRASSHETGWPGWPGQFPRSHLAFKSLVKFSMCSYERAGWLGSWDLRFSNQDLRRQAGKVCHVNTSVQFPGWKWGRACLDGIVLLCWLYFAYHKHPILITAVIHSYKSCQSDDRSKSYNFVFHHVCFFS